MSTPTRAEIIRRFVPASPLVGHLGIELVELGDGTAVLCLPFKPELATIGETVHGGAVATLLDTAGMAAAWADDEVPEALGGATVSMTVNYTAAANAVDLLAHARVVRRGRSLCFCEVTVTEPEGRVIAHGSMVHRYG